ncbi:hypothetical protein EI94DRAFT_953807 [Lactarius quietus]|nr:hypothetical protein EI94DRAFT_953807 [Lactarius quietus]
MAWSRHIGSGVGTTGNPSGGVSPEGTQKERSDFDGGANPLWTLYGKMAEAHDEARFSSLEGDLDAVGFFAALFSAVLASFLVQSIQNLQVNPAEKLVYYQNQSVFYQQQSAYFQQQSVAILAQISQHIASIAVQSSVPSTSPSIATPPTPPSTVLSTDAQQVFIPSAIQQSSIPSPSPLPYPAFKPSFSDIRVNACWLVSLICILSAALLVFFIKHRIRSYMQVFQRYDHPLKRARFRQFFLEGANGILNLAQAVPRLVLCSLFLFFLGLGDSMLNTNKVVGIITVVPLCLSGTFYLYSVSAHLWNPQSHTRPSSRVQYSF